MIFLASASPRRREILEKMGIPFAVVPQNANETLPSGLSPREAVTELARRKCLSGAEGAKEGDTVIGADTLVFLGDRPLGKPKDEEEALSMLLALSDKTHKVITGVAVYRDGCVFSGAEETAVTFKPFGASVARRYIRTGEPMDKAGAYGIQGKGARLIAGYKGSLDNVIGLPRALLLALLAKQDKRSHMRKIAGRLAEVYPDATCALSYGGDPWRLLVMGRLSAQCTDARVNLVCKELFTKYPDAATMAKANVDEVCEAVRPCGLYRVKGKDIVEASRRLTDVYGGVLPSTMEELLTFPGVGRKIANLLLGDIFHRPAVVTDTHCIRICGRLGAYEEKEKNPEKIEKILSELLPPEESADFCHRIVTFGREVCQARSPRCAACPLADLCPHGQRG